MELINNTLNEYLKEIEQKDNNKKVLSTGFYDLDYAIKGLKEGELIVIASRPAMGKTALEFNIAMNVAIKEKVPVAIFSLEMSKEQCIQRLISAISAKSLVDINKIGNNTLKEDDVEKIKSAIKDLSETEIYIDDRIPLSIEEIREECIKLKNEKDIKLIVIDYLHLISTDKITETREQKLSHICLELKKLAQELNIPIIVTSPLALEKRKEDKRPIINDLNTVGISKLEADVLIFLHRDDYYNIDTENKNIAVLIIARNKYGNTGTVKLLFKKDYLKYENIEADIEE